MHLLIRQQHSTHYQQHTNLHSTMYLLIPSCWIKKCTFSSPFTFHYVSINSSMPLLPLTPSKNLHSTMYLLILLIILSILSTNLFTFHYVSINSVQEEINKKLDENLHSTMYLLILVKITRLQY